MRCCDSVGFGLVGGIARYDGVHREEGVRLVDGGLGAFGVGDRVLDGPVVQAEFAREVLERGVVGVVDVGPHQGVGLDEVVGDRSELEVVLRLSGPPHPAAYVAHRP